MIQGTLPTANYSTTDCQLLYYQLLYPLHLYTRKNKKKNLKNKKKGKTAPVYALDGGQESPGDNLHISNTLATR